MDRNRRSIPLRGEIRIRPTLILLTVCAVFLCRCGRQAEKLPSPGEVKAVTKKVADWQIETFEEMGKYRALPSPEFRKKWHHRKRYHDLEWNCAALYAGMLEWGTVSFDSRYIDWLYMIGKRNNWSLHNRIFHADDHAVGQFYLTLYDLYKDDKIIRPTRARFDSIMSGEKRNEWHWHWCDALFMAPPVWTRLSKHTGDPKYLEYMDEQYRKTCDILWDGEERLFYRDKSYLDKKEKNGEKIFWSRGNGWVFGGLALMIPDFPEDWEKTGFYTGIFRQMAQTLKETQRMDGTWSGGILGDPADYPVIETSGTSFFAFGLAWGIRKGILDRSEYEPVLLRAWNAISNAVNEEGMLGFVQPVGAAPGESFEDYTELYGSGAFLAAGSEMYRYIRHFNPGEEVLSNPSGRKTSGQETGKINGSDQQLIMEDGGWCWYQDPRAVIRNGKLVVGGISGQSGDVRIGVFDLQSERIEGETILHKNLETDDHDVPALYVRPDGSILAVWAKHAREKIHYYSISSVDNYLEWGDTKQYHHDYEHKAGVTYMNLYYMQDEGLLYNFFRDGPTFNPFFITSGDHGETWGNKTHFIANDVSGRHRPYARYSRINNNTVGISYTDGHPRVFGNSLYYTEFRNGKFYNADGSLIKSLKEGPLRTSEGEKIYTGSETQKKPKGYESVPNSAWTCAMARDSENNPHIGYSLYLSNEDHRYRIASWDGDRWNDREIAYAGKCLYYLESSYTGLMAFDPEDPTRIYISTDVDPSTGDDAGGAHEIYTATIEKGDDIKSIRWEAITAGSEYRNIRPIVVSGEGYKVLLWLYGPWYTYTSYDSDVHGIILEKP